MGVRGFCVIVEVGINGVRSVAAAGSTKNGQRFAMKCFSKSAMARAKDQSRLKTEFEILTTATPSRFLLRCYAAFETESHAFLVTDLLSGGDLFYHLDQLIDRGQEGFPEPSARTILAEVALGIVHLHDLGFVHGDVKIENVMFDAQGRAVLIDFGLATKLPAQSAAMFCPNRAGSILYMTPELLEGRMTGTFTDWWAFGVLAYEVMTGRSPWSTVKDNRQIRLEISTLEMTAPQDVSSEAAD